MLALKKKKGYTNWEITGHGGMWWHWASLPRTDERLHAADSILPALLHVSSKMNAWTWSYAVHTLWGVMR